MDQQLGRGRNLLQAWGFTVTDERRRTMFERINVVTRIEHHNLDSCPCEACREERKRRSLPSKHLPGNHILRVPPSVAYLLGYFSRRNPHGSLARELKQSG